tara:strand:- start:113 stop:451 length:339 start_codon:yes stop_codon:yes gene_type:complete
MFIVAYSSEVLGGVGDTYVCKEKEINPAGYKAEMILNWNSNSFETKDKVEKGSLDTSTIREFSVSTSDYFISIFQYRNGYLTISFDGMNYTNHFVEKDRTFVTSYVCEKFGN